MSERPERVGICWVDAETFWWDATNAPICPQCAFDNADYDSEHGFFIPEARLAAREEELQGLLGYVRELEARVRGDVKHSLINPEPLDAQALAGLRSKAAEEGGSE